MADRRQIIDRIEKLYALASGGTSPGEAAAAVLMAEKLARKHGIRDNEIDKHTYTRGTSKQDTQRTYSDFWENITKDYRGTYQHSDYRRKYYQQTLEYKFIKADKVSETDKAYLLNVYLDEKKYPWSSLPRIVVRIWFPKSQVKSNFGNIWLVNEQLLMRNMMNNIPFLRDHHPVFKGRNEDIVFHFKEAI